MLKPGEIKDLDELIKFFRENNALHPERMPKAQQEEAAARIVGLHVNEHLDKWLDSYSELLEIMELAEDLEWSNVVNVQEAWARMYGLVDLLEVKIQNNTHRPQS